VQQELGRGYVRCVSPAAAPPVGSALMRCLLLMACEAAKVPVFDVALKRVGILL
jgi:hypothetical protein